MTVGEYSILIGQSKSAGKFFTINSMTSANIRFWLKETKKREKVSAKKIEFSNLNIDYFWGVDGLEANAILVKGTGGSTKVTISILGRNEGFC